MDQSLSPSPSSSPSADTDVSSLPPVSSLSSLSAGTDLPSVCLVLSLTGFRLSRLLPPPSCDLVYKAVIDVTEGERQLSVPRLS